MGRPKRLTSSGVLQHIIARCNSANPALVSEEDFLSFLSLVRRYKERYRLQIYSYVLLPTHVHLLLTSSLQGGVSRAMREILTNFSKRYNASKGRRGRLWEERYRSVVVEDGDPALSCMAYLDCHPVQAGIARRVGEYRWSSYACYAKQVRDPVVDAYPGYMGLAAEARIRSQRYRSLARRVRDSTGECGDAPWTSGLVFGSAEFARRMLPLLGVGGRSGRVPAGSAANGQLQTRHPGRLSMASSRLDGATPRGGD